MPVMVVGSGLGKDKKYLVFPACAPNVLNHEEFFEECRLPACHFVATDYGSVLHAQERELERAHEEARGRGCCGVLEGLFGR